MTFKALESMAREEEDPELKQRLAEQVEQSSLDLSGRYIGGLSDSPPVAQPEKSVSERGLSDLDEERTTVLFYTVNLEEEQDGPGGGGGFALVKPAGRKQWEFDPERHRFDFRPVFADCLKWQHRYMESPEARETEASDLLIALCRTVGDALPFLFDLPAENGIRFIPHDFLHRVPLHGAMDPEGNVLLQKTSCCYLPALGFAHETRGRTSGEATEQGNGDERTASCLHYIDRKKDMLLHEILQSFFDEEYFENHHEATGDIETDFSKITDCSPNLATIFCHGRADINNPFRSKLVLGKDMTLLSLFLSDIRFDNTDLLLSACETDLMTFADSSIDEQLSLAAVFLGKNAESVLGFMWSLDPDESSLDLLISGYKEKGEAAIYDIQKMVLEDFDFNNPGTFRYLYHALNFKRYF